MRAELWKDSAHARNNASHKKPMHGLLAIALQPLHQRSALFTMRKCHRPRCIYWILTSRWPMLCILKAIRWSAMTNLQRVCQSRWIRPWVNFSRQSLPCAPVDARLLTILIQLQRVGMQQLMVPELASFVKQDMNFKQYQRIHLGCA